MALSRPSLHLQVSEEYPIVDGDTGDLLGYFNQFPDREPLVFYDDDIDRARRPGLESATQFLRHEIHPTLDSLARALKRQRTQVATHLRAHGCRMAIAGTHPDSKPQQHTRLFGWYSQLVGEASIVARRMQISATTIHIGIEDADLALSVMNGIRYVLPHVLALSASSPFWNGESTGLKSYRQVLRDSLLRTNLPPYFNGVGEYRDYFDTLTQSNCIQSPEDIRWDVRWDEKGRALIFSICDAITSYQDLVTIVAVLQGLAAWMADLRMRNMEFRTYDRLLIMENKWRAIRYGVKGDLIDFGKEREVPFPRLMWELGGLIESYADALGTLAYVERAFAIAEKGSSADRQLAVWAESPGDVKPVVDFIADASEEGLS